MRSQLIRMRLNKPSGSDASFGTIEKHYAVDAAVEAARRYSPAAIVSVRRRQIISGQRTVSTSYIERQNHTLRMQQRRFSGSTNAFSKKLENHAAAVAFYVAHYNSCRVHETLGITLAMKLAMTDHIWTIDELVDAALDGVVPGLAGRRYGRFTVIEGGRGLRPLGVLNEDGTLPDNHLIANFGGANMARGKETIKPPTRRELTDASKELRKGHPSGARTMADASVAKRQGLTRSPKKR